MDKFWALPPEVKGKYARPKDYEVQGNTGYVAPGVEMLDNKNKAEIREAYNVTPREGVKMTLPDDSVPEFRPAVLQMYQQCEKVSFEVLKALAVALDLKVG